MEDKELLKRFRDKATQGYAFNLLVRKYQHRIYWHIRRMVIDHEDANDVTQNTFLKVWKGLDGFKEESQLYTWIYRIATNESLSFLKQKRTRFFIPMIDVEQDLAKSLEADTYFSGDEVSQKLQRAILKLPEKQRLVFNMKYFEDLTYEEISEILKTSVGALKASYHHAVKKLEEYLNLN
ncbi:MAG: sigma-70 family RNA polymerase sigma factor [Cytophagaceae bacterium]|nr:sigma-70 family RNA polymerase sigma factor [Cytophagaceae bacterium]